MGFRFTCAAPIVEVVYRDVAENVKIARPFILKGLRRRGTGRDCVDVIWYQRGQLGGILAMIDSIKFQEGGQSCHHMQPVQLVRAVECIKGSQRIDNTNLSAFLADADKQKPVVVCCYHGISSQQAAGLFINQGFEEVYSLEGGFTALSTSKPELCA